MKHQYFGDVNDYLKYGLLRCVQASSLKLGVCWMLTPSDKRSDGRKTQYLSKAETWRPHDAPLFDLLQEAVVKQRDRHLRRIEESKVLNGAHFFSEEAPDSCAERARWLGRMKQVLARADLTFFDPDNGLEVPSKPLGRRGSSKYVYWSELVELWRDGKSLLVFQHYPRETRDRYVARRVEECRSKLQRAKVHALSSANVLFLVVAQPAHHDPVRDAVKRCVARWGQRIRILPTH